MLFIFDSIICVPKFRYSIKSASNRVNIDIFLKNTKRSQKVQNAKNGSWCTLARSRHYNTKTKLDMTFETGCKSVVFKALFCSRFRLKLHHLRTKYLFKAVFCQLFLIFHAFHRFKVFFVFLIPFFVKFIQSAFVYFFIIFFPPFNIFTGFD